MKKRRGHYCWVCGRVLPNERYSGRGHRDHICKECQKARRRQRRAESPKPDDSPVEVPTQGPSFGQPLIDKAFGGQLDVRTTGSNVSPEQGLAFVERHGVVLQAARGPVPNLAEAIAGGPIRGSWWGHPKGHEIFRVAEAICESPEVLVCKLIDGKVTFIHRRLWPALVKLASRFPQERLAKTWNEHTPTGAHQSRRIPFPEWVPSNVMAEAQRLSLAEAEQILAEWPHLDVRRTKGGR